MTRHARAALLLCLPCVLVPGVASCWGVPDVERRTVRTWLTCVDCTDGELAEVVALGSKATRYLRAAIVDCPPTIDDSIVRRQATEGVLRARRYRADRSIPAVVGGPDSSGAVERQLAEFRLGYRLRAAEALHAIDPQADSVAVRELCDHPPPELASRPDFRAQFKPYGICP